MKAISFWCSEPNPLTLSFAKSLVLRCHTYLRCHNAVYLMQFCQGWERPLAKTFVILIPVTTLNLCSSINEGHNHHKILLTEKKKKKY